ncbi:hypothetical protein HAX54_015800, partial [Datura stramonium]|nr:hypothetical protein [Datura stramonium]
MVTCELMKKCEMLVIMKYNKGGIGRSMLTEGTNIPVCVLLNEFHCSKRTTARHNPIPSLFGKFPVMSKVVNRVYV